MRRMRIFGRWGVLCVLTLNVASQAVERNCGGGDGPTPLKSYSPVSADLQFAPAVSPVREFTVSEASRRLFYRTDFGAIATTDFSGTSHLLTSSGQPLSRLLDPSGTFLLTEGAPWFFDIRTTGWINYRSTLPKPQHLFWNGNQLYSIAQVVRPGDPNKIFKVERYSAGNYRATSLCEFQGKAGTDWRLGRGHLFPKVVFYAVLHTNEGNFLGTFSMDVRDCRVQELKKYGYPIKGEIESFDWFDSLKSFALKVNHPTKSLLWDSPTGCRYFNTENLKPIILNYDTPIIATFSPRKGISLIHLDNKTKTPLLTHRAISALGENDAWLLRGTKQLFLAPRFEGEANKYILKMKLP